jgi:phosphatidylserine/phosphatidylglycerophosphate/cardiolipin synthase-like enzyme
MTKLKLNITKARGIGVEAILDRRDLRAGRIAHSKIMIIDAKEIITGSFNFTKCC